MKNLSFFLFVFLLLLDAGQVLAQTKLTGTSFFVNLGNELNTTSNETSITHSTLTGMTVTDDPNSVFNKSSIYCRGIGLTSTGQSAPRSCNVCDVTDKDGDVFMYYSESSDNMKSIVRLISGTGKFKTLEGEGTAWVTGGTADGKAVFKWEINYIMD